MTKGPITVAVALRNMSEAKRPKRVKGFFTPQQMVKQFLDLKKETFKLSSCLYISCQNAKIQLKQSSFIFFRKRNCFYKYKKIVK